MSNNLPIIRFVFDRRKKATVSVASSVELEIYFSRNQRRRLSTGVKLYKNRKTFCNPPIKRNVDFLQALTQNEMRFFI